MAARFVGVGASGREMFRAASTGGFVARAGSTGDRKPTHGGGNTAVKGATSVVGARRLVAWSGMTGDRELKSGQRRQAEQANVITFQVYDEKRRALST